MQYVRTFQSIHRSTLITLLLSFALLTLSGCNPIKNSDAYKRAMEELTVEPLVIAEFGETARYSVNYTDGFSISVSGSSGEAHFVIDIEGNEQQGKAYFAMYKKAGIWRFDEVNLMIPGKDPIPLFVAESQIKIY